MKRDLKQDLETRSGRYDLLDGVVALCMHCRCLIMDGVASCTHTVQQKYHVMSPSCVHALQTNDDWLLAP